MIVRERKGRVRLLVEPFQNRLFVFRCPRCGWACKAGFHDEPVCCDKTCPDQGAAMAIEAVSDE